ncbi:hypothetical protein BJ875DRAFT_455665 [Amylocarpus encephaloides]|uniref:Uncharacterized protein n=1 Tax=Amylocarpus encephaloides TaxID=45428 RepID=A0A9P7YP69_9HELO|nr:hypothetical protein BJ875DRAFT_455665 [Amylocarpus encephaloides]
MTWLKAEGRWRMAMAMATEIWLWLMLMAHGSCKYCIIISWPVSLVWSGQCILVVGGAMKLASIMTATNHRLHPARILMGPVLVPC